MRKLLFLLTITLMTIGHKGYSSDEIKLEDVIGKDTSQVYVTIISKYNYCNYQKIKVSKSCFLLKMSSFDRNVFVFCNGICVDMIPFGEEKNLYGMYGLFSINNTSKNSFSFSSDPSKNNCGADMTIPLKYQEEE